jgi:hypothetical protein
MERRTDIFIGRKGFAGANSECIAHALAKGTTKRCWCAH